MSPFMQVLFFLTDTFFTLYILMILLRILLQWVGADFYNPVCQFIIKLTNPLFVPLRRYIPGYGGIDWAGMIALLVIAFAKQAILILIQTHTLANGVGLLFVAIADILRQTFYIYLFSTLAIVVMSWINARSRHPMLHIVLQLLKSPFNVIRKYIPPVAGFDLTPMIFIIVLIVFNILVVQVIAGIGFDMILDQ
jgi:YggT family protein